MCGIAGFWNSNASIGSDSTIALARRMGDAIYHRGPDSYGYWNDPQFGITFVHRRLSVLDLSSSGSQPMHSQSGRYIIVFNGEIYNHLELRKELDRASGSASWSGHSDTETLLVCCEVWGIKKTIKKAEGMFAFALWDKKDGTLTLARDRLGEKPLYYGWQGGVFLFGSELKALKAHSAFEGEIDRNALTLLLRYSYIPAPYSIYKGIKKLPPGTFCCLSGKGDWHTVGELPEPEKYWSLRDIVHKGTNNPFVGNDNEAVEALDRLLLKTVGQQMVADVPLGAFLSGGIDSSTIVALMQVQSKLPINTFTIGFNEEGYNEAEYALAVAKYLGTQHTELYISPREAMDVIPRLPILYDEPFSDSSQIPTFLISQMTRQHVTVSLSGDAGDELFGGYNRYFWTSRIQNKLGLVPASMRKGIARGIRTIPPEMWNSIFARITKFLPASYKVMQPGDKAHKLADILGANTPEEIYWRLVSHWKQPSELVVGATEPPIMLAASSTCPDLADFEHRMMYLDTMSYLPDDILTKVDRAAMGVSLETRVPFLNHRVVEFAWRLPLSTKIRDGQGKWILRQVLNKYIPKELIERPKMGFSVPIDAWLRGPLRDWAESLLDETRLRQEGFFQPEPIRQKWVEHLAGQHNWQYYLWDILMFQAWYEQEK